MSVKVGERFQSGNYGPLLVYQEADLADSRRMVGLLVEQGPSAGLRVGIPESQLGERFPKVAA